ncbi:Biopolymer transport protein ExbD/TolR [Actibacterium lipolyticum]|uniref:Biopolymer transport protein ExbD/TolR n=2 Tax=Actibacterium lipolyticum TaxID=1524263 RepID=A0A238KI57_9RHOB|nr:Biopolymer transport protein ExbD/TolR [Actibacterium lipolyticum]
MTSLIDVIFLLLLFFMLSSTFSKFGEVELSAANSGGGDTNATRLFLKVSADTLNLNGAPVAMAALRDQVSGGTAGATVVLVSLAQTANSQRLVDVLAALRGLKDVDVLVMG